MTVWIFCLLLSEARCVPVEGAPVYLSEDACNAELIPWLSERFQRLPTGTYVCRRARRERAA